MDNDVINHQDIVEMIERAKVQALQTSTNELARSFQHSIQEAARKKLEEMANEYLAEEVVPELKKHLLAMDAELKEAFKEGLAEIIRTVAKSLSAKAAENLGTSYRRADLVKAIFG